MATVQRELGEIRTRIDTLTYQNQEIFKIIDEVKTQSIKNNQQIHAVVTKLTEYNNTKVQCDTRFNSIEKGLAGKVITSLSAVITSLVLVLYIIFK